MCFEWRCYLVVVAGLLAVGCIVVGGIDLAGHEYISLALIGIGGAGILYFLLGMVMSALHTCMFPIARPKEVSDDDCSFGPTSSFILLNDNSPALLISPRTTECPTSVLIWLHGNAMTLKSCEPLSQMLADRCGCYILIPEYPGYGIHYKLHPWSSPSYGRIDAAAKSAFQYVTNVMGCSPGRIVVVGHSIGCGPAIRLASNIKDAGGLVLISPFSKFSSIIATVVNNYVCRPLSNCVAALVTPIVSWQPVDEIKRVRCPVLLLHGMMDNLIPPSHSLDLLSSITKSDQHVPPDQLLQFSDVWIRIASRADHIEWEGEHDVAMPIAKFTYHVVDDKGQPPMVVTVTTPELS
eukprot:TRINITY_DN31344_c0_g1_i1.p1 TRINITY_DN31344_c0_g1~~TRINITY_DN31344_c0_g1_i1.p1  ORF type:complete len:385 (+),score=49.36 TRINITY_DN31344_c0_g1_i1:103-1155(+)